MTYIVNKIKSNEFWAEEWQLIVVEKYVFAYN